MTSLAIVQLINALLPLAERAMAQGREVTKEELAAALNALDTDIDVLQALIDSKT
jgi:hypothetical protein